MRLSYPSISGSRWCGACRTTILRSFTSVSSLQQEQPPSCFTTGRLPPWELGRRPKVLQVRWVSTDGSSKSLSARSDVVNDVVEDPGMSGDENERQGARLSTVQNLQLPWYLQVSEQQEISRPLSDRQQLPDLPERPPPLLLPMLQYISVDLGLDDLTLLDLRELDPPPALGANTLMLIGTARGEKHLHVSADRLCRWLRSGYKLRPYADGLLGRNELKLKMRRRTRRAKLLGGLHGSVSDDAESELRSGWVCVNIGSVEPHESYESESESAEGIVGFGTQSEGVRIVVQMFTEEKRLEMDLEGLWGGLLEKSAQRERGAQELDTQGQADHDRSVMSQDNGSIGMHLGSELPVVSGTHPFKNQIRRVHTSASLSRSGPNLELQSDAESDTIAAMPLPQIGKEPQVPEKMLRHSGDVDSHGSNHPSVQGEPKSKLSAESRSVLLLRSFVKDLQEMPRKEALTALGRGTWDHASTQFLFSFYQTFPPFPTAEHWHCRVQLFCHAIKIEHPGYSKLGLRKLLVSMQLSGTDIPQKTLYLLLETILSGTGRLYRLHWLHWQRDLILAMAVLRDMSNRNIDVLTEEILILLHEAVGFHVPVHTAETSQKSSSSPSLPASQMTSHVRLQVVQVIQSRLNFLMEHYMISFTKDEHIIRLLTLFANQADWSSFFEFWALPAREMRPRSSALYAFMFDIVAQTNHQLFCMQTLRTYIPELDSEDPSVRLTGDVARSVMKCLKCAHPPVEEDAQRIPVVKGEWTRLWRRCAFGLENG